MTRAARQERGFTLVELLLAMVLMLIVTSATLTIFSVMERGARNNQRLADSERQARVAVDTLVKRLRNIASPTSASVVPQPLERAEATDLMFRTVSSDGTPTTSNAENLERYRYCLGTDKRVYEERQTWTGTMPAAPTTTGCGTADGWSGTRRVVAQNVVNGTRPLFKYQVSPTPGSYSEQTSVAQTSFPNDIAVRVELFVDPDTAHAPGEQTLNSRVFLRNQNRAPIASLSITTNGTTVTLNASDSTDPENNTLYFKWLDGTTVLQDFSQQATYSFKPSVGTHSITLVVRDVGGMQSTSAAKTVTCTSTACTSS